MIDLVRYVVAAEMLALIFCLAGLWAIYHDQVAMMPTPVRAAFGSVLYVLAGGGSAVIVNALIREQATLGALLLSIFVAPAVVACVAALVRSVVRPPPDPAKVAAIRNAAELARKIEHLAHLEPCPNPDCVRVRIELAQLIGSDPLPAI